MYSTGVETDEIVDTEDDENQSIRNTLRDLVDKMARLKRRMSGVVETDVVVKPGRKTNKCCKPDPNMNMFKIMDVIVCDHSYMMKSFIPLLSVHFNYYYYCTLLLLLYYIIL